MRLANMAYEELTEAMNRGWGTRNSTVGQLLQVERSGIEPPAGRSEAGAGDPRPDKPQIAAPAIVIGCAHPGLLPSPVPVRRIRVITVQFRVSPRFRALKAKQRKRRVGSVPSG